MPINWNSEDPTFASAVSIPEDVIADARGRHPWLPEDYWSFLKDIGRGRFGYVTFYEGPIMLGDIGLEQCPADFVAFGDDEAGCFFGFHPNTQAEVVSVDSANWEVVGEGLEFYAFVNDGINV